MSQMTYLQNLSASFLFLFLLSSANPQKTALAQSEGRLAERGLDQDLPDIPPLSGTIDEALPKDQSEVLKQRKIKLEKRKKAQREIQKRKKREHKQKKERDAKSPYLTSESFWKAHLGRTHFLSHYHLKPFQVDSEFKRIRGLFKKLDPSHVWSLIPLEHVIKNNQDSKLQALEAKSSSGHYFYYKSTESLSKLELMAVIALEIAHVHKNTSWNRLTKTPEKVAQSEFIQKTKEYSEEYRRHFESSYSADEIREAALHAQTLIEKSKLGPSGREVLAQWFKKLEEEQIQEAQKQSPYSRSYPGAAWQLEQIQ